MTISRLAHIIGTPPVHPALFVLAKVAVGVTWVLPLVQLAGVHVRAPVPGMAPVAAALALAGTALLLLAAGHLGDALRMGLPRDDTQLRTGGFYRYSRHPIYLSLFLLFAAACLYCPHPAVLACSAYGVVIHHRIALAEERFLERRFGEAWRTHAARVPRYLGLPRQ
jgi:protein-S-isoprenylcysteine O-methyltransferase Ste14